MAWCSDHATDGILERLHRTLLDEYFWVEGRGINAGTPIRAFTYGMPKAVNTEGASQTKIAKLKAA